MGSTLEPDASTLLSNSESRDPNGNEAILTKGQAESRMTHDIEAEFAVASDVRELILQWTAKWNAREDEGASVVGKSLSAVFSLFADEADGLELFEPKSGETDRGPCGIQRKKGGIPESAELGAPLLDRRLGT